MRKRSLKKKSRPSIFKPLEELYDLEKCLNILKVLPDIIYHIDPTGHFTFLSNSVDTLGYKPDELIGKHFSTIVHTDDVKQFGRQHILPKYKGKITGDENAPKLFDERRTGKRKTSGLEVRLLPKRKNKMIFGEVIAIGDISSTGHYARLANTKSKKFLGTIGIIRDITAAKERVAQLHYQADMLEHVSDAIISTDLNSNIRTWNNAAEKMYGWKFAEVEGKPVHKVTKLRYPHDNQDKVIKQFFKKGNWKGEVIQQTRDGRIINVQTSAVLMKNCDGNPIGAVAMNRDITELKKVEEKLRNSEEKYRYIVESAPDGIVTVNKKGIITSVNTPFCQRTGFSKEQIVGKHISKMPTACLEDIPKFIKMLSALLKGKIPKPFEFRWVHRNKSVNWGEVRVSRMKVNGKIAGYQAIIRDITERVTNIEARRQSDEKLALAVEAAGLGLWDQNFKTHTVHRNEQWAKMLGYTTKEIEAHPQAWLELIHPDDKSAVEKMILNHEKGSVRVFDIEHRLRTKDGQWRWISNWGKVVERDKKGKPLRALGVHLDITKRKQAEETLRDSEAKYSSVVENSKDAIIVHQSGIIKFVNQATIHLTGFSEKDFINKSIMGLIAPQHKELVAQRFAAHSEGQDVPSIYEIDILKKNGESLPAELNAAIIQYQGKPAALVYIRDITQRKQADAEIKQRNQELLALNSLNAVISQSLDLNDILSAALDKILEFMQFEIGGIYLVDSTRKKIYLAAAKGVSAQYKRAVGEILLDFKALDKATKLVKQTKRFFSLSTILANLRRSPGVLNAMKKENINPRQISVILMYAKDHIVGLLVIGTKTTVEFTDIQFNLLTSLTQQVTVAILNAQLYAQSKVELVERLKIEKQLQQSLTEKDALLKELHHRVKNNLQIISSLLNLQSSQTNDGSVHNLLLESQNRVRTMVLIHEKLYLSKDLSHVNANHYIKSIFQYLFDSYGVRQNHINRIINIDNIDLDIDTAIPCGLIINELVSNAIKYAFPSDLKNRRDKPEVNIKMHKVKQKISLVIADNGIGIDFDPKNSTKTTLGLQLVHALVDQIDGKITWEKNNGTKVTIIYPAMK